jgi:hypothetical protein
MSDFKNKTNTKASCEHKNFKAEKKKIRERERESMASSAI